MCLRDVYWWGRVTHTPVNVQGRKGYAKAMQHSLVVSWRGATSAAPQLVRKRHLRNGTGPHASLQLSHCTMAYLQQQTCCGCFTPRSFVYFSWGLNTAASAAFSALAIINSRHLSVSTIYNDTTSNSQMTLAGLIIACLLGMVMVIVYWFVSLALLIRNVFRRKLLSGFWYGVLLSSSLHVSMFMLLSALVLTTFDNMVKNGMRAGLYPVEWTTIYEVTFGLAWVLVATFLLQFFVFWLCKSAFVDGPITLVVQSRNPSASSAAVSVVQAGVPDVKSIKAAKAAKKAQDFNKNFGNDVVV